MGDIMDEITEASKVRTSVRWLDGTYDAKRTCDECDSRDCPYPVYKDYYGEVVVSKAVKNHNIEH